MPCAARFVNTKRRRGLHWTQSGYIFQTVYYLQSQQYEIYGLRGDEPPPDGNNERSLTMATYEVKKNQYESVFQLGNGDVMNIWGTADWVGASSGGLAHVYDGGSAVHFMLYDKGNLKIWSGGYAASTTVFGSNATFTVYSATVVDTVVGNLNLGPVPQPNYKARMGISGGAFVSRTIVRNGGTVILHDYARLVDVAVSNGGIVSGYCAQASNVIVNSGGKVQIAGKDAYDGLLKTLTVSSGASVTVLNRGIVDDVLICSGGTVTVSSGGTGRIISGGSARDHGVIGTLNVLDGGKVWECMVTHSGTLNVSGGAVSDVHVSGEYNSSPVMNVYSKGYASNTTVDTWAKMYVHAGGTANSTTLRSYGSMIVSSGAVVSDVWMENDNPCEIKLLPGASASRVEMQGLHQSLTVANGAYVEELSVLGGILGNAAATARVSNGGCVSSASVANGKLIVFSGGTAKESEVTGAGAEFHVCSGGVAEQLAVNGWGLLKVSGGAVNSLSAARYASAYVYSGGKVTGDIRIERDAVVSAYEGSVVDADISKSAPGDAARISGLSFISGSPKLTITVSAAQTKGNYKLASGVGSTFDRNFTVVTDMGTTLGTVAVGGTLNSGGTYYTLKLASNALSLAVSENAPPPAAFTPGDLNGDGRADLVMPITQTTHPDCGATGAWLIQSDQTAAWGDLSQRNAGWEIFGTGVTTAGKSTNDVYVRSTGNVVGAWTTDATGKVTGWATVSQFDASTQILGLGDFDGDGQTDLLLRNTNGAVGCHLTDGTGWNYFGSLGDEWTICAVGDLNGDGRSDVVLKHDAGFAGSWLTQADCTMAWADLDTLPAGFSIVGCGDFDGDGTSDVLLKNGNYYGAWIVQNGNAKSWMGLGDLGSVTVEQIGDFDADGKDDLRIRTTAGDLGAQLVKGADNLSWKYYGSVGSEWSTSLAAI